MGTTLRSTDDMLNASVTYGPENVLLFDTVGNTTAANTTSGYVSGRRFPTPYTVPSLGAGVTAGLYCTARAIIRQNETSTIVGFETLLGTLTVNGNSFAAGSSMPTKTVEGTSITTAAICSFMVATTALGGATTPTVTITYTDQDGNTGNSAALTTPSNPTVNTAYTISPHLASGDTGIRAVTNMSISGGTSGVLKVYGLLPIIVVTHIGSQSESQNDVISTPITIWPAAANDIIATYNFGSTTGTDLALMLYALADN